MYFPFPPGFFFWDPIWHLRAAEEGKYGGPIKEKGWLGLKVAKQFRYLLCILPPPLLSPEGGQLYLRKDFFEISPHIHEHLFYLFPEVITFVPVSSNSASVPNIVFSSGAPGSSTSPFDTFPVLQVKILEIKLVFSETLIVVPPGYSWVRHSIILPTKVTLILFVFQWESMFLLRISSATLAPRRSTWSSSWCSSPTE